MAATDLPCAPTGSTVGPGAIERAIMVQERAELEGEAKSDSSDGPIAGADSSPTKADADQDKRDALHRDVEVSSSEPGGVDVPLHSPPTMEAKGDLDKVLNGFEDVSVTDEGDSDGHRTPRQSNGHASFGNSTGRPQQRTRPSRGRRQAASTHAAWSDILTAAVDHSDEHVTKSAASV